ncbi:hypothetical protein N7527_006213 [Penicillium freii]|nr:hypothetical protein N7527_006213 [Penicillium freii]
MIPVPSRKSAAGTACLSEAEDRPAPFSGVDRVRHVESLEKRTLDRCVRGLLEPAHQFYCDLAFRSLVGQTHSSTQPTPH